VFHKGYHTSRGVTLPFYVYLPAGLTSASKCPAVLCLHGFTERGDDSSAVARNSLTTAWVSDSTQARWPSFVIVPQCPVTALWTGDALLAANDIVDSLAGIYPIDLSRLYVTGLSMGGYGTWELIQRFPGRFAAAIPLAGGGDPSKASNIRDVPLWVFQGAIDFVVNPVISRGMVSAIESTGVPFVYTNCRLADCAGMSDADIEAAVKNGATHLYTEYQYGGHDIWPAAYSTPMLMTWTYSKSNQAAAAAPPAGLPAGIRLEQNYPNPFNPSTTIQLSIKNSEFLVLKVYDLLGREVATLVNETKEPGWYSVTWKAGGMPSGVYIGRLSAGGLSRSIRMVLAR